MHPKRARSLHGDLFSGAVVEKVRTSVMETRPVKRRDEKGMKKRKGAKSGEGMLWAFGASGRSCTFQEVRSCCCRRRCSCAALPGPGSPESEIHQGPRQDFISTLNKKGSRVMICFKRFVVAGFYLPPRTNFPNRSVQLMSKPSGEERQSVI